MFQNIDRTIKSCNSKYSITNYARVFNIENKNKKPQSGFAIFISKNQRVWRYVLSCSDSGFLTISLPCSTSLPESKKNISSAIASA